MMSVGLPKRSRQPLCTLFAARNAQYRADFSKNAVALTKYDVIRREDVLLCVCRQASTDCVYERIGVTWRFQKNI